MQASLTEEIAKADELIISAESELARYDDAFQAVEIERESAAEHSWRAAAALEEATGEKEKVKEKLEAEMNRRHDLQVRFDASPSLTHFSDIFSGRTASDQGIPKSRRV
jgi:peptidoglycan hydrolase CwlO-like protein